jgi:dephospho-CoA kinase
MTKIIGLTGGIGSGKTTIANYFKTAGIPVYIADDQAREIMNSNEVLAEIKRVFGSSIFDEAHLDRKKLADIVFTNPEKLELLNAIIHPAVKNHFDQWILNYKDFPFIIYEAAILFESGSFKKCDSIINVTAPIELRIQRVMNRDKIAREAVLKRMNMQWTDEQRSEKSDFIIENSSLETTKLEFEKILKFLNN